jgi:hypothetical protein
VGVTAARTLALLAALVAGPAVASAQQFQPPRAQSGGSTRLGLFGFGIRGGVGFAGDGEIVAGIALDVGNLFTDRLRLRPSAEIGFDGERTYLASFEALIRLTDDGETVIPYLGAGASLAGHDDCAGDPECPAVWLNAVFGFELRFRSTFSWLVEYHGVDLLRRNRFYLGLTTRRGG